MTEKTDRIIAYCVPFIFIILLIAGFFAFIKLSQLSRPLTIQEKNEKTLKEYERIQNMNPAIKILKDIDNSKGIINAKR